MDDSSRKQVLGELLFDELRAIRELVSDVPTISRKVDKLEEDMSIVKTDIATINLVIKHQSITLNRHDLEIKELQAKAV